MARTDARTHRVSWQDHSAEETLLSSGCVRIRQCVVWFIIIIIRLINEFFLVLLWRQVCSIVAAFIDDECMDLLFFSHF